MKATQLRRKKNQPRKTRREAAPRDGYIYNFFFFTLFSLDVSTPLHGYVNTTSRAYRSYIRETKSSTIHQRQKKKCTPFLLDNPRSFFSFTTSYLQANLRANARSTSSPTRKFYFEVEMMWSKAFRLCGFSILKFKNLKVI